VVSKKLNERKLLRIVIKAAAEKKAEDITIIDLRKLNFDICDYFVICTAISKIHCDTIKENIRFYVKKHLNILPYSEEGVENLYWVILDYLDVVVHIMQKKAREYYNLEEHWKEGKIVKYEKGKTKVKDKI